MPDALPGSHAIFVIGEAWARVRLYASICRGCVAEHQSGFARVPELEMVVFQRVGATVSSAAADRPVLGGDMSTRVMSASSAASESQRHSNVFECDVLSQMLIELSAEGLRAELITQLCGCQTF
jgi:hypothetical protein